MPHADRVPVSCYLKNETEFREYLLNDLHLNQSLVEQILAATVNTSEVLHRVDSFHMNVYEGVKHAREVLN